MKPIAKRLSAALLFGSFGFTAPALIAPVQLNATVPEPESVPEPGTPRSQERVQGVPKSEPLPGQPGTIPERIQPKDATSKEEMLISAEEIKRAQEALKSKGYDPGAASGRMHAKTQEALREFQRKHNLTPTGVLDKNTADKLGVVVPEETDSRTPQGTR